METGLSHSWLGSSGGTQSVWVVAHRGASGHAPENTLASFRKAVELGARFIETDLQLSRDARFVAIHDDTLERTTNGHGSVHDFTLADLRQFDAGSWFGSEFAGEKLPTIEEILHFAREHDVVFYLELKPGETWGSEHALVGSLRDAGEAARVIVLSFDGSTLAAVRRLEPNVMTGLLMDSYAPDAVEHAVSVGARQLALHGTLITSELITQAKRRDIQVVAWTINHPSHMQSLIQAGVDGVITDYPDRFLAIQRR
jgi:glycerophosphoryl diester phosphodiesterase